MNASFVLLGLTMLAGAILIASRLAHGRRAATAGFACLALAGVGTFVVGLCPENTIAALHVAGAALAFVLGNLGMLVLGVSWPDLPAALRAVTLTAGTIGLLGLSLYLAHTYLGFGAGGMERLAGCPQDGWLIALGAYLLPSPAPARTSPSG